jgi:flagellar assembly protein FliH
MLKFTLKVGKEKKRLRIIRDEQRIEEELYKFNFKKYQKDLLQHRETDEERKLRKDREVFEEQKRIENEERAERLKELERKEAIITKYWKEFVISNEGKLLELDLSKVTEDSVPISVAKEEIQLAYERGMEDGQMQAFATYKTEIEKYQEWIRRIDSVADELKREHLFAIKNFEDNMIELSCMIAETILDDSINKDNSIVIQQVRKAIASVHNEKIFKIHVNPDLSKILEEVKSTLLLDDQEANKIEIYPNPSVPIGGCLLETSGGLLDARIKNQLRKIYKELELENERIFSTKDVEQELNQYLEDIEEDNTANNNNNNIDEIEISDDFNYDDLPEEYKEMFGDDIFGNEDIDLKGNILEKQEIIIDEPQTNEIDYQSLYDDELRQKEEEELRKLMEQENQSDKIDQDSEEQDYNFELDIPDDADSEDDSEELNPFRKKDDKKDFGLDDYNFENDFN